MAIILIVLTNILPLKKGAFVTSLKGYEFISVSKQCYRQP
jgi:hypothetical protein